MKIIQRILLGKAAKDEDKKEPIIMHRRDGLYLKAVPDKGRGLFCRDDIKAGEIIEITPVLCVNKKETALLKHTLLDNYIFSIKDQPLPPALEALPDFVDRDNTSSVVMGLGSFANHLVHPNAVLDYASDDDTPVRVLKAKTDIPAGTEICISYGIAWPLTHKKRL